MSESSAELVEFSLSGVAMSAARDGGWRDDNPRGFDALSRSPSGRVGFGWRHGVTMRRDDALDLADYLQSVGDVWASMTVAERGARDRPEPIWKAVEGIRKAAGR